MSAIEMTFYTLSGRGGEWIAAQVDAVPGGFGQVEKSGGQFADVIVIEQRGSESGATQQAVGYSVNAGFRENDVVQMRKIFHIRHQSQRILIQIQQHQLVKCREGCMAL
ncbi:hypothetical protein D3C87_1819730 [compost metagenome]